MYDGVRIAEDLNIKIPTLPPLRIVLIGGPCSGKGTIAPMLSQASYISHERHHAYPINGFINLLNLQYTCIYTSH